MPLPIVPKSKPQLKRDEALSYLSPYNLKDYQVILLGVRGYYKQTMGNPVKNDHGIYDDAIFIIGPDMFMSFNANTDPSVLNKKLAILKPGLHMFCKGNHGISRPGGGYPALRPATQGERLPVIRGGIDDFGIAINIHKGGYGQTSSEGCQTIYPAQWDDFIGNVYLLMSRHKQKKIPYVLVEM
jgi:hypothetical protein